MSIAQKITDMIDTRIGKVNTLAIGKVTKIDLARWRVSVRLKTKIQDTEIELANVPVALQAFGAGALHIAPAVDDIVVVGFSKLELQKQLRNRDIVAVNELVTHNLNHAIVLSGIHPESDTVPAVAAGEIVISHKSGTYFKFCANGDIETNAPHLRIV